jgi:hypothetical protein
MESVHVKAAGGWVAAGGASVGVAAGWQAARSMAAIASSDIRVNNRFDIFLSPFKFLRDLNLSLQRNEAGRDTLNSAPPFDDHRLQARRLISSFSLFPWHPADRVL